jgi:hypothetical protein
MVRAGNRHGRPGNRGRSVKQPPPGTPGLPPRKPSQRAPPGGRDDTHLLSLTPCVPGPYRQRRSSTLAAVHLSLPGGHVTTVCGRHPRRAPCTLCHLWRHTRVLSAGIAAGWLRGAERLLEALDQIDHSRRHQDDEHRREDQKDQREEHQHRRLLGFLLGPRAAPATHLTGEVAHDLAG